jgi:hypothetical protein
MVDTDAARERAEKTRMDPPPPGKEWSLGYRPDGSRAPEFDRLILVEQPTGNDLGLSFEFDEDQSGYTFPASGPGVRDDLVQAAMERLAGLLGVFGDDPKRWPEYVDEAATAALSQAGTTASGYLLSARNLVRMIVSAALEKLHEERQAQR